MNNDPRIAEIEAELTVILATPLPPPAEKHLVRERLHALQTERLKLQNFGSFRAIDLAARAFAIGHCPQRLSSYPMHLRERVMAVDPEYLKEYVKHPKQPPMSLEERQKRDERLQAVWARLTPIE